MTSQSKLKKAVRTRARKTGESYTAARHQVLLARRKRAAPLGRALTRPTPSSAPPAAPASPRGPVSDAATIKKTGHDLAHWFAVLDAFGKSAQGHTDRARYLYEEHRVPGWYCQAITVAYERARGLRVLNQSCTGDFQVSVSKAMAAPVAEIVAAFADARRRTAWLAGADREIARALEAAFKGPKPRAFRMKDALTAILRFPWDGSTIEIYVIGKPKGSTSVVAQNTKLADAAQVEDRRSRWRPALEALKTHLAR